MADVEAMFYQVKVKDEHRDVLRYLWWPDGNLNVDPVCYRMTVHPFGGGAPAAVITHYIAPLKRELRFTAEK